MMYILTTVFTKVTNIIFDAWQEIFDTVDRVRQSGSIDISRTFHVHTV